MTTATMPPVVGTTDRKIEDYLKTRAAMLVAQEHERIVREDLVRWLVQNDKWEYLKLDLYRVNRYKRPY